MKPSEGVMRGTHTSREFETEVRNLRTLVLAMGARCERVLELSVSAFVGDEAPETISTEVEELDRQIDQDELDIDARVLRMLALRQPVAFDLRFLTGVLKLATDLERIGDEAVNVSERAREGDGVARAASIPDVRALGEGAGRMLRGAMTAFETGDEAIARRVCESDAEIDERYHSLTQSTLELVAEHPEDVRGAIGVMKVAKYLERIADHSTNVAEEVIFIVSGQDVRRLRASPPGAPQDRPPSSPGKPRAPAR
jgi:phosphate transport system protein